MAHPWQYYAKVAGACFLIGACMEGFMIKTGFYDRVTAIEVARMEADGEEQRFMEDLRQEVLRQAAERNIKLLSLERNSDPKV